MGSKWTDETLTAARLQGDPDVDQLVADVLQHVPGSTGIGRLGYNHMLDLADTLVATPELALVDGSSLDRQLEALTSRKPEIAQFFDPIEAPDWVDEGKLAQAASLWDTDAILAIAALYAASLPSCYLMKKGVPALYQTEKLADCQYVFQRIYETGLMLESVLSTGGIKVIRDVDLNTDDRMADVLNKVDAAGNWTWTGHKLRRGAGDAGITLDAERVRREFELVAGQAKRYIWGGGYVTARKVRFLHASMRYMLLRPHDVKPVGSIGDTAPPQSVAESMSRRTVAWNVADLGIPINQEDLAFVLLTFGYLIPKGMESWGRRISRDQKEAFLHLWKVIGYVMGIRVDLMTDNLDDAAALYEQILKRNGGTSEPSVILTNAVMDFLKDYLPARFGLNERIPAELIIDQLGPAWAQLIVPKANYDAARKFGPRVRFRLCRAGVRTYYWLRDHVLRHIPFVSSAMSGLATRSAETLMSSWRDSFRRKPFYVPADLGTWVRQRGVTPEFEEALMHWRQSLFDTFVWAIAALVIAGVSFCVALVLALLHLDAPFHGMAFRVAAGVAVLGAAGAAAIMNVKLPAVFDRRPVLSDTAAVKP